MFSNLQSKTARRWRSLSVSIAARTASRISNLSRRRVGIEPLLACAICSSDAPPQAPVSSVVGVRFRSFRRARLRRAFDAALLAIVNNHVENFEPGTYFFRDR